jgi:hypothetical protein
LVVDWTEEEEEAVKAGNGVMVGRYFLVSFRLVWSLSLSPAEGGQRRRGLNGAAGRREEEEEGEGEVENREVLLVVGGL